MLLSGKSIPAGTGMKVYNRMKPKSVGVVSENVYSINDEAAQSTEE